jgi:hypothetical protein
VKDTGCCVKEVCSVVQFMGSEDSEAVVNGADQFIQGAAEVAVSPATTQKHGAACWDWGKEGCCDWYLRNDWRLAVI